MNEDKTKKFIAKATKIHGKTYSYRKTIYRGSKLNVTITCKDHGDFCQSPGNHLAGKGCKECGIKQRAQTKKNKAAKRFFELAPEIHNKKYSYEKVSYSGIHKKVTIICPDHGDFEQSPSNHLAGKGCIKCAGTQQLTTSEFKAISRQVHKNKYTYRYAIYRGYHQKVKIRCKEHGYFEQRPSDHMRGQGCPTCAGKRRTLSDILKKAYRKLGNEYDYSRAKYSGYHTHFTVVCTHHGAFKVTPANHLSGKGCPKCAGKNVTTEEIIARAKAKFGNLYDYSEVIYKGSHRNIKVRCKKHGIFLVTPSNHLTNSSGCPNCYLKHEAVIRELISGLDFKVKPITIEKKRYDFYLPELGLIIERDGEQHYRNAFTSKWDGLPEQRENDRLKTRIAKKHGYKFARIPFWITDRSELLIELGNIIAGHPTFPDVPDLKQLKTKPKPAGC